MTGTLVKGTFTTHNNHAQAYRSAGSHITRLAGAGGQSISIFYPTDAQQRIQNLEFQNAAGVTLATNVDAVNVSVLGTTGIGGGQTLFVAGAVTAAAGTNMSGVANVDVYAGTTLPAIQGVAPSVVTIDGTAVTMTTGPRAIGGNLTLANGGSLTLNGQQLTVGANFTSATSAGLLTMTNPADQLTINGNADFDGTDMGNTSLTAGLLIVKGNFTTHNTHAQSFAAFGAHTTLFAGSGTQTISLYYATPGQHHFANLQVGAGSTVSMTASNVDVLGNLIQNGVLIVGSPNYLHIFGALTLNSGSSTTVTGTITKGSCTPLGGAFSGFSCP